MGTTMGQRLQQALDVRGVSAAQLWRGTGLSKGTVYNILGDITRPEKVWADTAQKVCDYLRIRVDWLLYEDGAMDALALPVSESGWADVLGFAQAAGLGGGIEAQEYAETHKLKFRADSLSRKRLNPRHLAVIYGRGESMLPRIRSGDAILFDVSDTRPMDEALFVIQAQGVNQSEYSVKRCRLLGDFVFFDSLNPEGDHDWRKPRMMNDPKHPITIIGRVRWIGSWED